MSLILFSITFPRIPSREQWENSKAVNIPAVWTFRQAALS